MGLAVFITVHLANQLVDVLVLGQLLRVFERLLELLILLGVVRAAVHHAVKPPAQQSHPGHVQPLPPVRAPARC